MENFAVKFLALDRVPKILPLDLVETEQRQADLLNRTILRAGVREHPLPRRHIQSLLEAIVRTCELMHLEVHEQVYESLAAALNDRAVRHEHGHYVIGGREVHFKVFGDSSALVQNGSTGFLTWEAGKCLAWYLACVRKPSRVLELGCGTGVTGIIAAMFGVAKYVFTDYHGTTLENARANWELNKAAITTSSEFKQLDFLAEDPCVDAGVIVGADVLYDDTLCRGLVRFLEAPGCKYEEALIMSTIRTESTYKVFKDSLRESSVLESECVFKLQFSAWCGLPDDSNWRHFLSSATSPFDPVIELIRIRRK